MITLSKCVCASLRSFYFTIPSEFWMVFWVVPVLPVLFYLFLLYPCLIFCYAGVQVHSRGTFSFYNAFPSSFRLILRIVTSVVSRIKVNTRGWNAWTSKKAHMKLKKKQCEVSGNSVLNVKCFRNERGFKDIPSTTMLMMCRGLWCLVNKWNLCELETSITFSGWFYWNISPEKLNFYSL